MKNELLYTIKLPSDNYKKPIITKAFRNNTSHKIKLYTSYKVIKHIDSITSSSLVENNFVESITILIKQMTFFASLFIFVLNNISLK